MTMGISYTKGICREKRRLAGREGATTAYLDVGKSYEKRGSFNRLIAFIRGGERERGVMVPHIGNRTPVLSRIGGAMARAGFPCFELLTGGPRSSFEPWREFEVVSDHSVQNLPNFAI
jgi:hypothetical protein